MRATFCRKYPRSGCLAKPESWPSRCWRMSIIFSTRASSSRRKNSSAVFPANPIVQSRISIRSKVLDGFRRGTEGKFLGLEAERLFEGRFTFGSKERSTVKSRKVVQFEEPIFGFALRFELHTAAEVRRCNAAIEQSGA